jgi:hypothetical protein
MVCILACWRLVDGVVWGSAVFVLGCDISGDKLHVRLNAHHRHTTLHLLPRGNVRCLRRAAIAYLRAAAEAHCADIQAGRARGGAVTKQRQCAAAVTTTAAAATLVTAAAAAAEAGTAIMTAVVRCTCAA